MPLPRTQRNFSGRLTLFVLSVLIILAAKRPGDCVAQQSPRIIDVAPSQDPQHDAPPVPEREETDHLARTDGSAGNDQGSASSSPAAHENRDSKTETGLALRPPDDQAKRKSNSLLSRTTATGTMTTVVSSLAIVLGLFLLIAWFCRRSLPQSSSLLPQDAVQSLGRAPLAHRQFMHLIRVGNKLVLLSVTPHGAETLTEITDPRDVERILALCQQNGPHSISESFRQIVNQFADEATSRHTAPELTAATHARPSDRTPSQRAVGRPHG